METKDTRKYNGTNTITNTQFWNGVEISKYGHLAKYLIKEHGSKISNKLEVVKGKGAFNSLPSGKKGTIIRTIRKLKYNCAENGFTALVDEGDNWYVGKAIAYEDYGTEKLEYLKVYYKKIAANISNYLITKEYMIDPRFPNKKRYIAKVQAVSTTTHQQVNLSEVNKLIGRDVYKPFEVLETPYIPATIFEWDDKGQGVLSGMNEIFLLERQLLREIPRDLNLSRKKVLYKTRLARKSAEDLEIEMNEKGIVVFEDGNAIFSSPIDLWSPALAIQTITNAIDWLMSYALKVTFAAKDSMATGAQKGDKQISEINQAPQNILEDRLETWSETMSAFLTMITGKNVEVEFQAMTTPANLMAAVVDSSTATKTSGTEDDK